MEYTKFALFNPNEVLVLDFSSFTLDLVEMQF